MDYCCKFAVTNVMSCTIIRGLNKISITGTSGGLLSSSRKRKIQEQMAAVQSAAEEYEVIMGKIKKKSVFHFLKVTFTQVTSKRYSGGLGKNPWGGIAQVRLEDKHL